MNLLYISPRRCWPLNTGARLRDYYLARYLAGRCSLTYVSLSAPDEPPAEDPPPGSGFAQYIVLTRGQSYTVPKLVRGMVGPLPVTILNYYSRGVAAEIAQLLAAGQFDAVQLESTHLMPYLPLLRAAADAPLVLADWHNIESELMRRYGTTEANIARRLAARRTAQLLESAEGRFLAGCDVHTVASQREREKLAARVPGADIHVIPNGVDVGFYSDAAIARACERTTQPCGQGREILFVGSMDYHANIDAMLWFAREAWPALHQGHPGLCFTIAGRAPAPAIRALASDHVIVTGTVDDVRPFYARAAAVVAPLRVGSGTRLKILEAMAAGVPVVSTRLGAEGLEVEDGREILLADTAADLLSAVERLLSSSDSRRAFAAAGRKLVSERYDWPILGERLYQIYAKALAKARHGITSKL